MWKNRNVWIILTGEFVAGLGLWLGIIGNLEFMQEKVPSDFVKALILAGGLLAGVAIGPLAGRLTDQGSKKKIMLISSIVRALSVLFMFVAIETGSVVADPAAVGHPLRRVDARRASLAHPTARRHQPRAGHRCRARNERVPRPVRRSRGVRRSPRRFAGRSAARSPGPPGRSDGREERHGRSERVHRP